MTRLSKIEALATSFLGTQQQEMSDYCRAAECYIQMLLRDDVTPDALGDLYIYVCALLVLSMYQCSEDGVTKMDAGALSLSFDDKNSRLLKTVRELLAPWCKPQTAFTGVRA